MKLFLFFFMVLFSVNPAVSAGLLPANGSGVFSSTMLERLDWYKESGTNIGVVENVTIRVLILEDNLCAAVWRNSLFAPNNQRFSRCVITRNFGAYKEERSYSNVNGLDKNEAISFFSQTGRVGNTGTGTLGAYFSIMVWTTSNNWYAEFLPLQGVQIPPAEVTPPVSCSASGASINHGQLSSKNITGNRAGGDIVVFCSGDANIRLKIDGYSNINGISMNNNRTLLTRLTLDGRDPGAGVNAFVRKNSNAFINVESTLSGVGDVTPGEYSKAIVVNIAVL